MASFETFDLGRVLQTAEAIKGMRRQAETDKLRDAYLSTQTAGAQQAQQFAQQNQTAEMDIRTARQHYLANQVIESATDPIAAAKQFAPESIAAYEAAHGQGSFDQLSPEQVKQIASYAKQRAAVSAGIMPKPKQIDAGGKLVTIDENTGQPMGSVAPIDKSASPDALLSSQTSTANSSASNATSRANAQLSADTSRSNNEANVAATIRGQDLTNQNKPGGAQANQTAWNMYQTAKDGLVKGLSGTETGPLAGRMPAVTTGQQVAQGSIAAMAPVLKQLFRNSGEGTFTDKDQELLLDMVPTRKDTPDARSAKLANIDAIVKAKLNIQGGAATQGAPTATGPNGQKLILKDGQWTPFGG